MYTKILFKCDRKKCGDHCSYPVCELTSDPAHAINFYKMGDGYYELCHSTWDSSVEENVERLSEGKF